MIYSSTNFMGGVGASRAYAAAVTGQTVAFGTVTGLGVHSSLAVVSLRTELE